jgi:hypothetical protein
MESGMSIFCGFDTRDAVEENPKLKVVSDTSSDINKLKNAIMNNLNLNLLIHFQIDWLLWIARCWYLLLFSSASQALQMAWPHWFMALKLQSCCC